jgi:hypothetical protein
MHEAELRHDFSLLPAPCVPGSGQRSQHVRNSPEYILFAEVMIDGR